MGVLYFELADFPGDEVETQPFMRLCLALETKFPNIRGWQQIQDLCDIATEYENCFFTFRDTWLKTTVTLKNPDSLFRRPLSKDALRERILSPGVDDPLWTSAVQRYWMQLLGRRALTTAEVADDVGPQITIRRNVLPRQRYWMKLLESYRFPHLTRDFYTRRILDESLREGKSLQEIRRERCFKCALATSLRSAAQRHNEVPAESVSRTTSSEAAAGVVDLQFVDPTDIILGKEIASGTEGSVSKVVWRNGTYAMKIYKSAASFERDHKIATMRPVLHHPHILQAFGHSFVEDDDADADQTRPNCLLMELLDGDLLGFMHEAGRLTKHLSRLDKLDVLLQIASAMERLHENKVVHGDLKPGNILRGDFEVSGHVRHFLAKVADFGSAKIIDSNFVPSEGTTRYTSPEVLMTRRSMVQKLVADGRAKPEKLDVPAKLDVYSFGVMAYEILTDCEPIVAKDLYEIVKGETRFIDSKALKNVNCFGFCNKVVRLVEKCSEWDPKQRPTFSDVCATLQEEIHAQEKRDLKESRNKQKRIVSGIAILLVLVIYNSIFVPCSL